MKNWFAVARSVFTHRLFHGDEYSKREAWLFLVSHAGWSGDEVGVFSAYESELSTVFGWSKSRVHRFLQLLIQEHMIEPVSEPVANRNRISYRITKYQQYQTVNSSGISTSEPAVIKNRTSSRTALIYKDLNTKKHKQEHKNTPLPPFQGDADFELELAKWIAFKADQHRFTYKTTGLEGLYEKLRKMGATRATVALRYSREQGWKGVFEPRIEADNRRPDPVRPKIPLVVTQPTPQISEQTRQENLKRLKQITGGIL